MPWTWQVTECLRKETRLPVPLPGCYCVMRTRRLSLDPLVQVTGKCNAMCHLHSNHSSQTWGISRWLLTSLCCLDTTWPLFFLLLPSCRRSSSSSGRWVGSFWRNPKLCILREALTTSACPSMTLPTLSGRANCWLNTRWASQTLHPSGEA